MRYQFENYVLDTHRYELYRDDVHLPLRPLAFHVLAYLLEHRDRVISKDELFEHIWPDEYVGDAALSSCLKAIRQVVNDSGRSQRIVRTVRGHGYRFVAPVSVTEDTEASTERPITLPLDAVLPDADISDRHLSLIHSTPPLIGRTAELNQLSQALTQALQGERQVVFITGEAGIGKTSVLQAFIEQVASTHSVWIGQGHCIEQYGTGEAYLPILEAFSRFGQAADRSQLVDVLNQFAPTWLIQMPALVAPDGMEALSRRVMGSTPDRMLREAAEAVEALTAIRPLMLCLEDLHWSDHATLNLLSYLARRPGRARLIIVSTYRPSDVTVPEHPLPDIVRELRLHQQCEVLPLALLTVDHITTYLNRRLSGQVPPHQALQPVAQLLGIHLSRDNLLLSLA